MMTRRRLYISIFVLLLLDWMTTLFYCPVFPVGPVIIHHTPGHIAFTWISPQQDTTESDFQLLLARIRDSARQMPGPQSLSQRFVDAARFTPTQEEIYQIVTLSGCYGTGFLYTTTYVPIPILMTIPSLPLLVSGIRAWSRKRTPGHCPCGYNLTGNQSGTCPECGHSLDTPP